MPNNTADQKDAQKVAGDAKPVATQNSLFGGGQGMSQKKEVTSSLFGDDKKPSLFGNQNQSADNSKSLFGGG